MIRRLTGNARGLLAAAAILGALSGYALEARAEESKPCEHDVCSLDSGNCFNTRWDYNCREIAGGCEDADCPAVIEE